MRRRPGHLAGLEGMTPRARRFSGTSFTLGAFGKGFIAPPPSAPPGSPSGGSPLPRAIDKRTRQPYIQDPKCPEGEITQTKGVPCAGDECCDGGDCDPPGTIYQEADCYDDPNYEEAAPALTQNTQQAPSQPQQISTQPALPQKSEEEKAKEEAEAAALQAKLMALEAEHEMIESTVTAPYQPPPSGYTGSSMPVMTTRRSSEAPSSEERLQSLVSSYQEQKAMQRASAPPPQIVSAPSPVAIPRQPPPQASRQEPQGIGGGIFAWLRTTLFGAPRSLDGYGLGQTSKKNNTLLIIAGLALVIVLLRSRG